MTVKRILSIFGLIVFVGLAGGLSAAEPLAEPAIYLDAKAPVEQRVDDLLSRMTLDEKIGQLMMGCGGGGMGARTETLTNDADIRELARRDGDGYLAEIQQGKIGAILQVMSLKDANAIQRIARQSRLGIPVLIDTDAIHGVGWTDEDTTIFPAPLGLASSFDPAIAEAVGRASAVEARATGARWIFTPTVDVARDPRWGRMGETFGEDVLLVADMSEAYVRGMQTPTPEGWATVAACAKHLVGGGQPINGMNNAPFALNELELRTNFLPPFERCVKAGVLSIMAAHNETLGVPCHSSSFLLDQVLRREWGFQGTVVSDWGDIDGLISKHRSAASLDEAVTASMTAGIDVYMLGQHYAQAMRNEIQAGHLDPKRLDQAVRHLLRVKFQVGLFDQPFADPAKLPELLHSPAHRQLALDAARKGIVLLKNPNGLLPLEQPRKILVTGPNAANAAVLGDWVLQKFEAGTISVLRGLREQAPAGTAIAYAETGDLYSITDASIAGAVKAARDCDVVVAVVGELSLRSYGSRMTCGENHDRIHLNLFGRQDELLRALYATGKPVVVVLVNGRALCIEEHVARAAALVEAWEPGEAGGQAIAEILYGKVNPSGRLPVTIPRSEGQLPIFYNHKKANFEVRNPNENWDPLYWFGAGLSYTTFSYSNLRLPARLAPGQPLQVAVEVKNTGKRAGDEVVLIYCRDLVRSTVPPVKELKGYARVSLQPGESKTVAIEIPFERLAIWNPSLRHVVEAGEFEVLAGSCRARFAVGQTVEIAPVTLAIDSDRRQAPPKANLSLPVVVVNSQNQPWQGNVRVAIQQNGKTVSTDRKACQLGPQARTTLTFEIRLPKLPGPCLITAELAGVDGKPVRHEYKLDIIDAHAQGLAYQKPATASSIEKPAYAPTNAVDGDPGTYWSSAFTDPAWLAIDLGKVETVSRVRLAWEVAYAREFAIQVSLDGNAWTDAYKTEHGQDGVCDIAFAPVKTRWIRLYGTKRGTGWGYAVRELQVFE